MRHAPHFNVSIYLGRDILQEILSHHGVQGWNKWIRSLRMKNIMHEKSPISIHLDYSGANLTNRELDGIDLQGVNINHGIFSHSSLYGACFSHVTFGNFMGTDLRKAHFENCDLTGTHFTEAMIDEVKWDGAFYNSEYPPIGLPDDVMGALNNVVDEEEIERIHTPKQVTEDATANVYVALAEIIELGSK